MNWKSFLIGLLSGVIIALTSAYFLGNRYQVSGTAPMLIKVDKLTGRTWRVALSHGEWSWVEMKDK